MHFYITVFFSSFVILEVFGVGPYNMTSIGVGVVLAKL